MIMTVPACGSPPATAAPSDHGSRALLLDLDGVLLDTRPVMRRAWQRVREVHGVALPFRDYERHLGREFGDIMERLGVTDAEAVRRTYEAESVATAHLAEEFAG
ncbi:HAD family hydrolase, partial [Streptomyces sp. SID6648]|nr:HAD family hydrolase [Streptomyces sp. SID6648]